MNGLNCRVLSLKLPELNSMNYWAFLPSFFPSEETDRIGQFLNIRRSSFQRIGCPLPHPPSLKKNAKNLQIFAIGRGVPIFASVGHWLALETLPPPPPPPPPAKTVAGGWGGGRMRTKGMGKGSWQPPPLFPCFGGEKKAKKCSFPRVALVLSRAGPKKRGRLGGEGRVGGGGRWRGGGKGLRPAANQSARRPFSNAQRAPMGQPQCHESRRPVNGLPVHTRTHRRQFGIFTIGGLPPRPTPSLGRHLKWFFFPVFLFAFVFGKVWRARNEDAPCLAVGCVCVCVCVCVWIAPGPHSVRIEFSFVTTPLAWLDSLITPLFSRVSVWPGNNVQFWFDRKLKRPKKKQNSQDCSFRWSVPRG